MRDFLSELPAPLPLYILLELRDLKALYAAILSSPYLYAAFRLNACRVFKTIVERSMTNELISQMDIYMQLLRNQYYARRSGATFERSSSEPQLEAIALMTDETRYTWKDMPFPVIFHVVAQAVRIYDLAYSVLRAKLDYLVTLKYEKLADTKFSYRRPQAVLRENPKGALFDVPARLQDPSWIEESRAMRALWLLNIMWRATRSFAAEDIAPMLVRIGYSTSDIYWLEAEVTEMASSVLYGPTLCSPSQKQGSFPEHNVSDAVPSMLQTYLIPHPPYRSYSTVPNIPASSSSSPSFSQPPNAIPTPSSTHTAYQQDPPRLRKENPTSRFLRAILNPNIPNSPLQNCQKVIFDCLGLDFWDFWRTSTELELRALPRLFQPLPLSGRPGVYTCGEPGYVSFCDQKFRANGVYRQQERREQEGWRRGR